MKTLSRWASRHRHFAISLIILCELVNGFNGVSLGSMLAGSLSASWLTVGVVLLIGGVISIHRCARLSARASDYGLERRYLLAAFLGNFLLFSLLGGIWERDIQQAHPSVSARANRRVAVSDTLPAPETAPLASQPTEYPAKQQAGQRTKYILLGVLEIGVAFMAASLACNIACAGYGFLAFVVFYFGFLGSIAGSVYYFARSAQKPIKPRHAMSATERRRDSRRFWLPWLVLAGLFSILILANS